MNQRRPLKELNLLDRFLFDEVMEDPENVKTILDIILSQNTSLRHPPQTAKEMKSRHKRKIHTIFRKEVGCIRESLIVNCCHRGR